MGSLKQTTMQAKTTAIATNALLQDQQIQEIQSQLHQVAHKHEELNEEQKEMLGAIRELTKKMGEAES